MLIFLVTLGSLSSCVVYTKPARAHTVVVKKAPRHHRVVVIKGKRYYTWDGKHYKKTRRGFVFVKI